MPDLNSDKNKMFARRAARMKMLLHGDELHYSRNWRKYGLAESYTLGREKLKREEWKTRKDSDETLLPFLCFRKVTVARSPWLKVLPGLCTRGLEFQSLD